MPVWLVRAGAKGEHEQKFLDDGRIYLTKRKIDFDLTDINSRDDLLVKMADNYHQEKPRKVSNHASQVWPFGHLMQLGDIVVLPAKLKSGIYIGEIVSDYHFNAEGQSSYLHWRDVKWCDDVIPRNHFANDLLLSFSAAMTICQISRNDAEARLKAMALNDWQPES